MGEVEHGCAYFHGPLSMRVEACMSVVLRNQNNAVKALFLHRSGWANLRWREDTSSPVFA